MWVWAHRLPQAQVENMLSDAMLGTTWPHTTWGQRVACWPGTGFPLLDPFQTMALVSSVRALHASTTSREKMRQRDPLPNCTLWMQVNRWDLKDIQGCFLHGEVYKILHYLKERVVLTCANFTIMIGCCRSPGLCDAVSRGFYKVTCWSNLNSLP